MKAELQAGRPRGAGENSLGEPTVGVGLCGALGALRGPGTVRPTLQPQDDKRWLWQETDALQAFERHVSKCTGESGLCPGAAGWPGFPKGGISVGGTPGSAWHLGAARRLNPEHGGLEGPGHGEMWGARRPGSAGGGRTAQREAGRRRSPPHLLLPLVGSASHGNGSSSGCTSAAVSRMGLPAKPPFLPPIPAGQALVHSACGAAQLR